jgi:hypothetical protein
LRLANDQLQVLSLRHTQLPWNEKTQGFFSSLQNLRELSLDDIGDVTWPISVSGRRSGGRGHSDVVEEKQRMRTKAKQPGVYIQA